MQNLHFSVVINAPREKVWNAMLGERSFREWTQPFAPGSHYKGDWKKGSKILFLAPGKSGAMEGMVSRIRESRPYEYISIEHLGIVQNGKEDTQSEAVKDWVGAKENYTFKEKEGRTELLVEADANDEFKEMFQGVWPRALKKLKEISEKQNGKGAS
jgi:hypothetical protein